MNASIGRPIPVVLYLAMIVIPLLLAIDRLVFVTGSNPIQAMFQIGEHPLGSEAIVFTFIQATMSSVLTRSLECRLHGGLVDINGKTLA